MSRLDEIQVRLDAATPAAPGHWRLDPLVPHVVDIRREQPMSFAVIHDENGGPGSARPDTALIAHAPADLAALVAFARRVRWCENEGDLADAFITHLGFNPYEETADDE